VWEWRTRYYPSGMYAYGISSLLFMIMYDVTTSPFLRPSVCRKEIVPEMC